MLSFELQNQLPQVGRGVDWQPLNQAGFAGIAGGDDQGPGLLLMGLIGQGDHPATGSEAAVEPQFAGTPEALQLGAGELPAGHQQRQGDREIKGGAFLA